MSRIAITNSFSRLYAELDKEQEQVLIDACSFRKEGYQFSPQFKRGVWDGYIRLLKKVSGFYSFPTGLVPIAHKVLKDLNIHCVIEDERVIPGKHFDWFWTGHSLRDYQADAVAKGIKAGRGIYNVATGGGKMTIAAKTFQELGRKGIIAVLTKEAVDDTYEEFKNSIGGASIGRWNTKHKTVGDIVVTTIPSLEKSFETGNALDKHFGESDVFILDEGHFGGASTYYKTIMRSPAYFRFAQTGTVQRSDGGELYVYAGFGRILTKIDARFLQDQGYLSESHIRFIASNPPSHVTREYLAKCDPEDRYMESIVRNMGRNRQIIELLTENNDTAIVGVKRIEHAEILSEMSGIPFISGQSNDREHIKNGLVSGDIRKAIVTTIFDLSVNIPRLKRFINAGGHSPESRQIQRLGRVLRLHDSKDIAEMYDFNDFWDKKASEHTGKRVKALRKEGHTVEVEQSEDFFDWI